jgi:hypothetical protein
MLLWVRARRRANSGPGPAVARTPTMFDVVRLVALVVASVGCVRARFHWGFAILAAIGALEAAAMVPPLLHRGEAPPNALFGVALLFWGPSGLPAPASSWVARCALVALPWARAGVTCALAWLGASLAYRRSKPLRPETAAARAWDSVGLRFVFVATCDAMILVTSLLVARFEALP